MKATYDDAIRTCNILKSHGYDAFLAGGCVRDILLGVDPNDYDITTSATPEEVQKICGYSVPVGISFGVVKVICGENRELDVATFRTDGKYSDARRPDSVEYTKSAEEDVKRRDFTINALLMTADGKIIDHVGGQADLKNKLLRTVGDSFARFAEDSLRMIRAIRFAVKYNLDIERNTWESIKTLRSNIKAVSKERVTEELIKMMTGGKADKAFWSLNACGLWDSWFGTGVWETEGHWKTMHALNMVEVGSSFSLPLAIIIDAIYNCDKSIFKDRLALTNVHSTQSEAIIAKSRTLIAFTTATLAQQRRMLNDPDLEICRQFIRCKQGEHEWEYDVPVPQSLHDVMERMAEVATMGFPERIITGDDLIDWKYIPGDVFTQMLYAIQTEQLEGRVVNKDQARQFLLDKFRAAPRTLEDGTKFDGMAHTLYAAQCKNCNNTMSFEVAHKPSGEIDWTTLKNQINNDASMHNFYANCTFKVNPDSSSYWRSICTGKKAKHKFVRMII